jgi:hypothetical protein
LGSISPWQDFDRGQSAHEFTPSHVNAEEAMFENRIVECNKIEFETQTDQTLRTCSPEFACQLAVSIKEEGLFHPIVIRPNLQKPGFLGVE